MPETKTQRQPKRQARKYVPRLAVIMRNDAKANKPTDIESVVTRPPFGFDAIKDFCLWLTASVARMDNPLNSNGTPNKGHGSKVHKYSKAILSLLKDKYGEDHPDYFVSAASESQSIIDAVEAESGVDIDDENALAESLGKLA